MIPSSDEVDDKYRIISEIEKKINKTSLSDFIRELNHQIKEYYYNRQKNIGSMENMLKERKKKQITCSK